MLERLVEHMAAQEGITEILKEEQPLEWVVGVNTYRMRLLRRCVDENDRVGHSEANGHVRDPGLNCVHYCCRNFQFIKDDYGE